MSKLFNEHVEKISRFVKTLIESDITVNEVAAVLSAHFTTSQMKVLVTIIKKNIHE